MIVAEIQMLTSHGLMDGIHGTHNVRFDNLGEAEAEYQRIAALMRRRDDKANDLPKILEVVGAGNKSSFPLDDLRSVALCDYAFSNREQSGVKETFPNLFT